MKIRLAILGAAVTPFLLSACGDEAPPLLSSNQGVEMGDDGDRPVGTLIPPSPAMPGATVTPSQGMPGQVMPGTPGAITPGAVSPGTITPGTMTGTPTPAPTDSSGRPVPLMPPMPGATGTAAPTPVPDATPGAVTPPPVTPTPTPAAEPEPAAATCEAEWTVGSSGFVSAPGGGACWQGYAWASATPEDESTFETATGDEDFSACGADCKLCISGTVAPTTDFSGVALLGLNLNQGQSSSSTDDVVVTGSVTVDVSNAGGSALRVQLSGSKDWCYDLEEETGSVTIPLSGFVTECWEGGAHVAYDGENVEALMLVVPGSDTDETAYDICLNSVTPG